MNSSQFNTELFNPVISYGPRIITKSSVLNYCQKYLNDPLGVIWPTARVNQWINQAEVSIGDLVNTIWVRFWLPIQQNQALYDLPPNCKTITRITYRGWNIDILTQKEIALLSPVYMTQQSRPRWAQFQFEGMNTLRFFPVPNENLFPYSLFNTQYFGSFKFNAAGFTSDIYKDTDLINSCIVSAYVYPLEESFTFSVPDYFVRQLTRLFVQWKAYASEGDGQDPDLASYYKQRFDAKMEQVVLANTRVYNNKERNLADVAIQRPWRVHRPILPPNYGTPVDM